MAFLSLRRLYYAVHDVSKRYRIPFEDLVGEAFIAWGQATKAYKKDKDRRGTYLFLWITKHLKEKIKSEKGKIPFVSLPEENIKDEQREFEWPIDLSQTAVEVAKLALEIYNNNPNLSPFEVKKKTKRLLKKTGWKTTMINSSFKELSEHF